MALWEGETHFRDSLRGLPGALTPGTAAAGLISALWLLSCPTILVFQAAQAGGYSMQATASWLFGSYASAGLMGLVLCLAYKQPIAAGISTPAAALLIQLLPHVGLQEAVGAYLMAGALTLVIGASGLYGWFMRSMPKEIVMGLLAGVILQFAAGVVPELATEPLLTLPSVLAFFAAMRWLPQVSPVFAAFLAGLLTSLVTHGTELAALPMQSAWPELFLPVFTWQGALSVALPLTLVLLSAQNATALGVLMAYGYKPPATAVTLASGVFSLLVAPMGTHSATLATPRMAILADDAAHPAPGKRYGAAVIGGLLMLAVAPFAPAVVAVLSVTPVCIMRVVAGLGLVPVLRKAFEQSVGSGRYPMGALLALLIAAANVRIGGISSVFWALVAAPLLSRALDADWRKAPEA